MLNVDGCSCGRLQQSPPVYQVISDKIKNLQCARIFSLTHVSLFLFLPEQNFSQIYDVLFTSHCGLSLTLSPLIPFFSLFSFFFSLTEVPLMVRVVRDSGLFRSRQFYLGVWNTSTPFAATHYQICILFPLVLGGFYLGFLN